MKTFAAYVLLLLQVLWLPAVQGAIEELEFASAEDRARYETLVEELRCPKCTSGNLAGSDAPIAADLRTEILKQINAGRSDDEIYDFMTARYGDFILYRPPLTLGTALLWFGPGFLLLAGFIVVRRMLRTAPATANGSGGDETHLSSEEQQKLTTLLGKSKDPS